MDVIAVHIKHILFGVLDLFQLFNVVWCSIKLLIALHVGIVVGLRREGLKEIFESGLEVVGVDVCAPENLGVGGHFCTTAEVSHCGSRELGCILMLAWSSYRDSAELRSVQQPIWVQEAPLANKVGHLSRSIEN